MTATTSAPVVTEPGVYEMSAEDYHADPVPAGSLSSSGARRLLPPSCPAIFDWQRRNPPEPTDAFDFGHAAHDAVLGKGPEIVRCDFDSRRTNDYKAMAEDVRARGGIPLLPPAYQQVQDMAEAIRRHPIAGALFHPDTGTAEVSGFWIDEESGIWRRIRLDWLPTARPGRRVVIADYKTAVSADRRKFAKAAADHGYHQQAAWYLDGAQALGLAGEDAAFVFVVQEKTAPYLVSVVQLDVNAMRIGALLNRRAITTYAECSSTGTWPGYASDVELVSLPTWIEREFEDQS